MYRESLSGRRGIRRSRRAVGGADDRDLSRESETLVVESIFWAPTISLVIGLESWLVPVARSKR